MPSPETRLFTQPVLYGVRPHRSPTAEQAELARRHTEDAIGAWNAEIRTTLAALVS